MLNRIVLAVVWAVIVGLVCLLIGMVLSSLGVPPAEAVGGFLTQWAWVIGVLAGLWQFFGGGGFPALGGPR